MPSATFFRHYAKRAQPCSILFVVASFTALLLSSCSCYNRPEIHYFKLTTLRSLVLSNSGPMIEQISDLVMQTTKSLQRLLKWGARSSALSYRCHLPLPARVYSRVDGGISLTAFNSTWADCCSCSTSGLYSGHSIALLLNCPACRELLWTRGSGRARSSRSTLPS